ncbi:MAG: YkgJ family cysteine cluster protein [Planctomycetota bacterium]
MKSVIKSRVAWYSAGLCFECRQCGRCCSGPAEGYIWVTKPEIQYIADFLKISVGQLRREYIKRVGFRSTVVEKPGNRDCVFLREIEGHKTCMIYPVRPNQCRTWPFWPDNLRSPDVWSRAAQRCSGINRGKSYSFDEIEGIRKGRKWWQSAGPTANSCRK